MIHEYINKEKKFEILFKTIFGGAWDSDLENIIKTKLKPDKFERINHNIAWHHSEIEFIILKNNIDFKLIIDKADTISVVLTVDATDKNKQKLREWAMVIANEVEKLKK